MKEQQAAVSHVFGNAAQVYLEKFADLSAFSAGFKYLANHLQEQPQMLDLGCGPGNSSKALLRFKSTAKITGIDLAPQMIALAQKEVPQANFKTGDILDLDFNQQSFDGIIAGFCLPYLDLNEGKQLINNAVELLKVQGILYVSTMVSAKTEAILSQSSSGKGPQVRMQYYAENDLKALITQNGLKIGFEEKVPIPENPRIGLYDCVLICHKI